MHVEYVLTKEDYLEFNIFHMTYSKSLRKSLFVQRYLVSFIFLIVPFVVARFTSIPLWYWLTVFGLVYVLWVVFYWKYFRWTLGRRISRMIDEGKNVDMLGKQSLRLDEDGIVNTSRLSESKTNYEAVEKVIETKEYVYIYISSIMAYIIPVKSFGSIDQKEELINKLNDKVDLSKNKT